jgi:hypothetical protein
MFRVLCNERKVPRQFIVAFYDGTAGPVMVEGPYKSRTTARRAARRIARHRRYRRSLS